MWLDLEIASLERYAVEIRSLRSALSQYSWCPSKQWSAHREQRPHVAANGRRPCTRQGGGTQKKTTLLAPWAQTSSLQDHEKINFLFKPMNVGQFVLADFAFTIVSITTVPCPHSFLVNSCLPGVYSKHAVTITFWLGFRDPKLNRTWTLSHTTWNCMTRKRNRD